VLEQGRSHLIVHATLNHRAVVGLTDTIFRVRAVDWRNFWNVERYAMVNRLSHASGTKCVCFGNSNLLLLGLHHHDFFHLVDGDSTLHVHPLRLNRVLLSQF